MTGQPMAAVPRQRSAQQRYRVFWPAAVLVVAACSSSETGGPVGPGPLDPPPPELVGDPVAGAVAFTNSCAECHTNRDGFDLAHFRYPSRDIIRRALGHVDTTTAHDIDAYIRTLNVPLAQVRTTPFQPGGRTVRGDVEFWEGVFGTQAWPTGLTAQALRAIDPKDFPIPFVFPEWSNEGSNEDWLPDTPLHGELLDYGGGAVRSALSDYYATAAESDLVRVLTGFHEGSKGTGGVCTRADIWPCFNARRWMSALAAQHYLRTGQPESVPLEVAEVWWDVGESAIGQQSVARSETERDRAFRNGTRWLYLGYIFAPEAFEEPAGYMGTFMNGNGFRDPLTGAIQRFPRVSTFAALRRMVGNGRAHRRNPVQYFHDGRLATARAPFEIRLGVAEFALAHFVARLEKDRLPAFTHPEARALVSRTWNNVRSQASRDLDQFNRMLGLHDQALQLLQ